ncbi:MAG: hypothetical protein JW995_00620 [Melioribacteraceae bacterium]|nr:hypothetical protein [Melioribacteraceae bacterium]
MCGIFGLTLKNNDKFDSGSAIRIIKDLFLLSESRGKEASGIAVMSEEDISILKSQLTAKKFIKTDSFNSLINSYNSTNKFNAIIGHSRLVTSGYEHIDSNNQPVSNDDIVTVHNGIIVNHKKIFHEINAVPKTELDSEIIPAFISNSINSGKSYLDSIVLLFRIIKGMTSVALLSSKNRYLVLATNNGSLYYAINKYDSSLIFASEKYILTELSVKRKHLIDFTAKEVSQIEANHIYVHDISSGVNKLFKFDDDIAEPLNTSNRESLEIKTLNVKEKSDDSYINTSFEYFVKKVPDSFEKIFYERQRLNRQLKRCTQCILPETVPYVEFDEEGVCNFCRNYKRIELRSENELKRTIFSNKYLSIGADCLLPFSGGRDSSYVMHYVVKKLGIKPIAFSYDWGMITDLARRNQSRLCGELGVEHIMVSADIRRKRENIKKNVTAWLRNPKLGMVPLFMAGDKQYFYYINLLLRQNNLNVSILGENLLETTNFKSGFAGIHPNLDKSDTYSLRMTDKMKLVMFYASEFLKVPSYLNSSLFDTFGSFKSYYITKHENINLFNYIQWDESKIITTLKREYDWESDPGTKSTWRIGDGTAAFYNYIYYMLAGFTEHDTFRSNQIREGMISRGKALENVSEENLPRWDSLQWYFNTIKMDFREAIEIVNKTGFLYMDKI